MWDQFLAFLAGPVFEDSDKMRVARLLHVVMLTLFVATIVMIGTVLLSIDDWPPNSQEMFLVLMAIVVGGIIVWGVSLVRHGHFQLPSIVLLFVLWGANAGWIYFSKESINNETGILIYDLIIVLAGLLLGKRAGITCTVLSLLAVLGVFVAEGMGINVSGQTATLLDLFFILLPIALTGSLLSYAIHNMDQALGRARDNERDLTESNRELQSVHLSLEKRNKYLRTVVQKYVAFLERVEQGDLTCRMSLDDDGNAGEDDLLIDLGHRMNRMVAAMQDILLQIRNAMNRLKSSASEILTATTQQAAGASQQSAAISQTTTTVDELKTIAEQSVSRAQEVAGTSQRTIKVSRTGQQSVDETIGSMAQIKERVEGIAENILALSEQTQQIGEIIATVNDIAAQSNILALNASVEAARAGEYGKGFAVVAVEVRNLAEQSRQATAQVRAILSDIQKATNTTVMATEEGTKGSDEGVQLAAQAGESIEQLGLVIEESAQAATQLVAGGRQQASGVEQVALAMQNINQATQQSLESTRQAEKAARELNDLAEGLVGIVEYYRL
ncbi:MAG: methyl-accepting chemotaxis protein [Chloroflexi bacterium]|nr:methyl-accepting chemotaxis protein [Chloroflexota bacterium]